MRSDLMHERKCLHVKIMKDAHIAVRQEAILRNISIQEIVNELAEAIARKEPFAIRLLDRIAADKLRRRIEAADRPHGVDVTKGKRLGDLDGDALYKIIQQLRDADDGLD